MMRILFIFFLLNALIVPYSLRGDNAIKFSGKKGLVVTQNERDVVLTVVNDLLDSKDSEFLDLLVDLNSPFPKDDIPEVADVEESVEEVVEVEEPEAIVYDDASVLKVVASNFAQQVRGTLARGSNNYIQLQGGNLLKTGSSFPVRLPEAENQVFIVNLIKVTSEDYTLKLGGSTLTLTYSDEITGAQRSSP